MNICGIMLVKISLLHCRRNVLTLLLWNHFYFGKVLPTSPFKCHCDGLLVKSTNLLQTYTKLQSDLVKLISLSKVFRAKNGLVLFRQCQCWVESGNNIGRLRNVPDQVWFSWRFLKMKIYIWWMQSHILHVYNTPRFWTDHRHRQEDRHVLYLYNSQDRD